MELTVVLIMALTALWASIRGVNVYDALCSGAAGGLTLLGRMLPALVCLLPAAAIFRESGALDAFTALVAPLLRLLGIPEETALLMLLRPLSGSAALAVGTDLMAHYGVDSPIGRTAAIMLGSTETTFYTISVYFGAAGIRKTRYTVLAALFADFVGFFMASLTARLFFPA